MALEDIEGTALVEELQALSDERRSRYVAASQRNHPEVLYHYTTAEGLLGILKSNALWATDIRFLNDPTEMIHAERLIEEELKRACDECATEEWKGLLNSLYQTHHDTYPIRRYVACFCEDDDLLHQWLAYGQEGVGFAIGIKAAVLRAPHPEQPYTLRRVVYGDEEQRKYIRDSIEWICRVRDDLARKYRSVDRNTIQAFCCGNFRGQVFEILSDYKHRMLSIENEWRAVAMFDPQAEVDERSPLNYRVRGGQIIPYVELCIPGRGYLAGHIPVKSIRFGPTADPELTYAVVKEMLDTFGYRFVEIRRSQVPFRQIGH